jgi:predicted O-methyltransferase YrrM
MKSRTLLWYIRRPQLLPHLFESLRRRLTRKLAAHPDFRVGAVEWCASQAVDTRTALTKLTGQDLPSIEDEFPEIMAEARRREADCPVKMGGPGGLDLLYGCCRHLGANRVIETGVVYGWSTLAILLALRDRPGATLVSTDMPYPNLENDVHVGCVIPEALRQPWTLLRLADRQGLPRALQQVGQVDVCHYDSDKSYAGRMWAAPLLWSALRPGGYFISDDIDDNLAFRHFADQCGVAPVIVRVGGKFVGVLVKPTA